MPFIRYIPVRSGKITGRDTLSALISASSVTREIADMLQFMPAKAAASLLLLIFETIKDVQSSKNDCYRLARRCLSLLVDIRDQLVDREESAPPSLIKAFAKFEETLEAIYQFMKREAEQKWSSRLMRKSTIENALEDYNAALDDAARAFQIATLINIHLSVGEAVSPTKSKTLSSDGSEAGPSRRAITLPPYPTSAPPDGQEVPVLISDVEHLSAPPLPMSRSPSASFDLVERLGSITEHEEVEKVVARPETMNASYDLIDLSSPTASQSAMVVLQPTIEEEEEEEEEEEIVGITDHHGFSRYHQSQFRMKGRSRSIKDGWWAGAVEGGVDGQQALMLRYDGDRKQSMKRWVRDVKLLQNVYHPSLPQMVGYSNDETPTPFILLANVQTRLPQALLLDSLKNASLARCAQLMLRFYRDTLDAALYLQQQLNLSDSKIQDYVENASYRIDAEQTVVMGLPPPEIDNVVSWRNFGLAHSIRDIYLKILPTKGIAPRRPVDEQERDVSEDMQRKVNHLTILARALLPNSDKITIAQERLHKLLGSLADDDEEGGFSDVPLMTLREIRKAAFAANTHQQAWSENAGIPPHKFAVGDLGYLPKGENGEKKEWKEFVVLCNVLEDGLATLDLVSNVSGQQGGWQNGYHNWEDLSSWDLPGDLHGWAIVVPPEAEYTTNITYTREVARLHDAWNYLLDVGKAMAETHGVKPEELILITRTGTEQRFRIRDLRRIQYWPASVGGQGPGGSHGFASRHPSHHHVGYGHNPFGGNRGGESGRIVPGQDISPKVFYLFTSAAKEHEPYFALKPIPTPRPKDEKPPELDPNVVRCFASLDIMHGFLNFVQLHAEDFAD